ncbi:hypothetical protein ACLB2K_073162 [Fragaria x ananassa]
MPPSTAIKGMVVQLEESLRGEMAKIREDFMVELTKMRQVHEKELNSTLARIEEMHGDLALCKHALAMGAGTSGIVEAKSIEVQKPKSFRGSCNAREVDNFLWGLDQYFRPVGITEEDAKIRIATLYLTDIVMLWWRRRRGDVEKGPHEKLKKKEARDNELANTFGPTSAIYEVLQPFGEDECSRSCLDDCNCVVAAIFQGGC